MLLEEKSGFTNYVCYLVGLPRWLSGNPPALQETQEMLVPSLGLEDPM